MAIQGLPNRRRNALANVVVWIGACLIVLALIYGNFSHKQDVTIVVDKVEFQQEMIGDKESLRTEYHCRVYTDKGLYEIAQRGLFFAHPELIGRVHEGDTLSITTRGYNIVALGIYPLIVEVH